MSEIFSIHRQTIPSGFHALEYVSTFGRLYAENLEANLPLVLCGALHNKQTPVAKLPPVRLRCSSRLVRSHNKGPFCPETQASNYLGKRTNELYLHRMIIAGPDLVRFCITMPSNVFLS